MQLANVSGMQLANVSGRQVQTIVKTLQVALKVWETADTQTSVAIMPNTSEMNMIATTSSGCDVEFLQFSRSNLHNLPSPLSFSVKIDKGQHNLAGNTTFFLELNFW